MAIKLTVLCHFWNEEFFLPYWLRHHREIFDHGIMINYASTDRSVEIIRELVPTWEIIDSRNHLFDTVDIDTEVMSIEHRVKEWKMVLNVTEFLIRGNLKTYINQQQSWNPGLLGFRATGVNVIDSLDMKEKSVDNSSLVKQRHHGYFEIETNGHADRQRLIHKNKDGRYGRGRHSTTLASPIMPDFFVFWYCLSPMKYIKNRCMAIQTRIPERDKKIPNFHHVMTEEAFEARFLEESSKVFDLLIIPEVKKQIDLMRLI